MLWRPQPRSEEPGTASGCMLKLAQTVCCTLTLFGFQGPTGFIRDPMVPGANLFYTTADPALSTLFQRTFSSGPLRAAAGRLAPAQRESIYTPALARWQYPRQSFFQNCSRRFSTALRTPPGSAGGSGLDRPESCGGQVHPQTATRTFLPGGATYLR